MQHFKDAAENFAIKYSGNLLESSSHSFTTVLFNGVLPHMSVPRTPTLCTRASVKDTRAQTPTTARSFIISSFVYRSRRSTSGSTDRVLRAIAFIARISNIQSGCQIWPLFNLKHVLTSDLRPVAIGLETEQLCK